MKRFKKSIALLLALATMFALMVSAGATMQGAPMNPSPTFDPTATIASMPRIMGTATISGDGVNVRSGPSTSYPGLGQLYRGDRVGVHYFTMDENSQNPNDIWYYCLYAGSNGELRGYIYMDYISNLVQD